MDGFVDALLQAPLGVALLARLESRFGHPDEYDLHRAASEPFAVRAAVEKVATMTFGDLVEAAVLAGETDSGPWISDAPSTVASAYRNAEARVPIAEAIDARFGVELHAPIDRRSQQWWTADRFSADELAPLFRDFDTVYDAGQFTWAGLWTVSDPPEVAHAQLIDAWEMYIAGGPITRWWLPATETARVFEIHQPDDWARLVSEHPKHAAHNLEHWELPSRNQNLSDVAVLMAVPGQRGARTEPTQQLVPDWRSVATQYDGVHLSWAGFITSEGCITDLGDGVVTMLRYWFSERTHWLADVFDDAEPAPQPALFDDQPADGSAAIIEPDEARRRTRDSDALRRLLGR